jgi:hypothetical protein
LYRYAEVSQLRAALGSPNSPGSAAAAVSNNSNVDVAALTERLNETERALANLISSVGRYKLNPVDP